MAKGRRQEGKKVCGCQRKGVVIQDPRPKVGHSVGKSCIWEEDAVGMRGGRKQRWGQQEGQGIECAPAWRLELQPRFLRPYSMED